MASLRTLVIALAIHGRIIRIYCCPVQIVAIRQSKVIHNTTKYAPYLTWSHGEKSNCLAVQMNTCALILKTGEHDPVDFIFTWLFLL